MVSLKMDRAESVVRACRVLRAFRKEGETLRLRDVVARTQLSKTTVFRLLQSLDEGGLVEKAGRGFYVSRVRYTSGARPRVGFAAQTGDSTFSQAVADSIRRAAETQGMDLVAVNNRYSRKMALRNAESLIRRQIDVVVEFQTYESIAPLVAARFQAAGIPVIAIEIPHPGAVFFGIDNFRAGRLGGRALGLWAKKHWDGKPEEILLIEEGIAGPLPRSRVTGMLVGLKEVLPAAESVPVTVTDRGGTFQKALDAVRAHLRRTPERRTLVAATDDPTALGALRAFEECGRHEWCAVMGQNGIPEARAELRSAATRLIGTVAYFPERWGERLMELVQAIVDGQPVAPACYMKHELLTAENVDRLYPLDEGARVRSV
jgi:ribose transport system substrate-binding protein